MAWILTAQCDFHGQDTLLYCRTHHISLCLDCIINKVHDTTECKVVKKTHLQEVNPIMTALSGLRETAKRKLNTVSSSLAEFESLKQRLLEEVKAHYNELVAKLDMQYQNSKCEIQERIRKLSNPISERKEELQSLECKIGSQMDKLQKALDNSDFIIDDQAAQTLETEIDDIVAALGKYSDDATKADGSFRPLQTLVAMTTTRTLGITHIDEPVFESRGPSLIKGTTVVNKSPYESVVVDSIQERAFVDESLRESLASEETEDDYQPICILSRTARLEASSKHNTQSPIKPKPLFLGGKHAGQKTFEDRPPVLPIRHGYDTPFNPRRFPNYNQEGINTITVETHEECPSPCAFSAIQTMINGHILLLDSAHNTILLTDYVGKVLFEKRYYVSKILAIVAMSATKFAILLQKGPVILSFELSEDGTVVNKRSATPVPQSIRDIISFDAVTDSNSFAVRTPSALCIIKDTNAENFLIPHLSSVPPPSDLRTTFDFATQTEYILNKSTHTLKAYSIAKKAYIWWKRINADAFEPHNLVKLTSNTSNIHENHLFILCHNQIVEVSKDDGELIELNTDPQPAELLAMCATGQDEKLLATKSTQDRVKARTIYVLTMKT